MGIAALMAACSGLSALNLITPEGDYTKGKDIAYGSDEQQTLDVYLPKKMLETRPVVVFVHGGSWQSGDKHDYGFVGQALATEGIMAVIINYRQAPKAGYPAFLEDTAEAVTWVHNHIEEYGANPNNLFVAGHSAGAYNAVMVATNPAYMAKAKGDPAWIKGAIGLAGPYSFLPITDPKLIKIFGSANNPATQPVTYVKKGLPPMLLVTGDADDTVKPTNTQLMAAKLRADGNTVVTKFYPGVGHAGIIASLADGFRDKTTALFDIADFVKDYSKMDE